MKKIHNGDRKHPNKLGDGMFMHNIFTLYKDVEWEVHDLVPSETYMQLQVMYEHKYNLRKLCIPTGNFKNFRHALYEFACDGLVMTEPSYKFDLDIELPDKYVTVQYDAVDRARSMLIDPREYAEGYELVDLDKIPRDRNSVARLFEVQRNAEFHIGPDSGTLWTALAVGKPVKVSLNEAAPFEKQQSQRAAVLRLLANHEDVELL